MTSDEISYARSGSANLAYHVMGAGPIDILLMSWVIPMESQIEHPRIAQFLEHLASFGRLIRFDRRGVGLSDPTSPHDPPTLDLLVEDVLAVLDEVRAQQVCVIGDNGGQGAVLLAAKHPDRVTHLVLDHPIAALLKSPQNPTGLPRELLEHELDTAEEEHRSGRPLGFIRSLPSVMNDPNELAWFIRAIRRGASPGTMRGLVRVLLETNVDSVLPAVRAPTLVLCRRDVQRQWVDAAAYVAQSIPNATLVELPGNDPVLWVGDWRPVADAIHSFVVGGVAFEPEHRALVTVLFTDIVDSTRQAAVVGDKRWREFLDSHDALIATQLARFGGRPVKSTGDGVLATFEGPARAVRCACAIRDAVSDLGIDLRAGLHTGEIEIRGEDVSGIAVHVGQRVSALAGAGEVLVSRTVMDLVAGSGIEFEGRGEHELKGVPGSWQLYAVK